MNLPFAPVSASLQSQDFDRLFVTLIIFSGVIITLVAALILTLAVRFRDGSDASRHKVPVFLSREIEIGWTSATVIAALFLFWWASAIAMQRVEVPVGAMEVHVEAKQWMWKARQPNGARELNALHVPVDQPVVLYLNSQDVIHSFFVPAFRIKQDVVPGRTTTLWFEATEPGRYSLLCAEYCGTDHSRMEGEIVVMKPDDYARWLDTRPEGDTLAAEGRALFTAVGCAGCHDARSNVRAPKLEGLYGHTVPLADGRTVNADDAYLRDSILLPRRDVVAGFVPIMPSFKGSLDDADVTALVAYLRVMGTGEAEGLQ